MLTNVQCSFVTKIRKKPVEFKWKWGGEELPIVDQYTYLGVEISKTVPGTHASIN